MSATLDELESLAYRWGQESVDNDPDWPYHDDTVTISTEEADAQGVAAGLRQAAVDLLDAIGRGRRCSRCTGPIYDPQNTTSGDDAVCRGCGDPS